MSEDRRPIGLALAATAQQTDFVRNGEPTRRTEPSHSSPDSGEATRNSGGNSGTPVPLTTRLSPMTAGALRRAYLEQKTSRSKA